MNDPERPLPSDRETEFAVFPLALLLAASSPGQSSTPLPQPRSALPDFPGCLQACPSPNDPTAPFLRLPKVTPVEECRGVDAPEKCGGTTWTHTFHKAARFVVPKFDLDGEPMEGDSLVIYEGMKLTVNDATGVYDLAFTATAPPTAVTVRLQLVFEQDRNPQTAVRLTLPPIRIDADDAGKPGDNSGRTVRIHHRGQSDLFKSQPNPGTNTSDLDPLPLQPPPPVNASWKVQRHGTARLGSARAGRDAPDR